MADRKTMVKEFQQLEKAIERLKKAEKELNELYPPQASVGPEVISLRANLKNPAKVDEVEKELDALRKRSVKRSIPEKPFVSSPKLTLPSELESIYYDSAFIGSGGFARVFRAKRRHDGTEVAVKIPINLDAEAGKSFMREINSWQHLKHMNIAKLYDFNVLPIPYLEIELCQISLNELPRPLDVERAASMTSQVSEGLKYAHSQGVFHRDLKPHNILLKGEILKIVDWGLSKIASDSKSSRGHTYSLPYAAPEQLSPQKFGKPDQRTDIYQVGVVFYELVTGELPFKGDNITEIMGQILTEEPKAPSLINPLARSVEPIIMKCLRKEMKERYQSVAEMQKDLAEYLRVECKEAKSQGNISRSRYYCVELCLHHLRNGELAETLKCITDLKHYCSKEVSADLDKLVPEIEYRLKEGQGVNEEFMDRAAVILHQIRMVR